LPVTVTMSFDMHGRTMMGVRPEDAVKALRDLEVVAIGVNCGNTLEDNLAAVTAMRSAAPDVLLIAKPNAGLPRMEDTVEVVYDVTPQIMADYALKFGNQRVKMLGGCCGSTPAHIAALREALEGFTPPPLETVLAQNQNSHGDNGTGADRRNRRRERRKERV